MKNFFRNHPILFAIFILIASRIVGLGVVSLIKLFQPNIDIIKELGWLIQMLFATTSVALVYWSGDMKGNGLTKPVSKKEWLLWIPPLVLPIYILIILGFNVSGFSNMFVLMISALCVAINEEIVFRGVLIKGFLRFGTKITLFVPSIIFGLIHLGNILVGGDIKFGIFQALWTAAAGIAYTALVLRNKSILPAIVFHFILDTTEYFATGENGVHELEFSTMTLTIFLFLTILFAIYGLIMYKSKRQPLPI
ncbi:membrane protease YdiL (CAAX protease family) [Anoxybacillus mongoliensis]|uniref:Membrane protease YdiL (CAAX protease family) n=1 Tax=Anoxybacillus mongoliensis TaxID=452565 RepID=A0A7W8JD41_9BACL|nr:CPBP family intramembrane glutamic endopeptidase [Anoxybacillus mongoliensis]MBB5354800.1 membrane protease YdiL (CAAX protease family) [Anoxybacillus mongoliensis]